MKTITRAIVNLMKILGISRDDVKDVFSASEETQSISASQVKKGFEDETHAFKDEGSHQSPVGKKLVDFVASDDGTKQSSSSSAPKSIPAVEVENKLVYAHTSNGMQYVKYNDTILGIVITTAQVRSFVLALKNHCHNIPFGPASTMASSLPAVAGKKWIVPSDNDFLAIKKTTRSLVNDALKELGGDQINRTPFLSSSSQANPPSHWNVRFILPL